MLRPAVFVVLSLAVLPLPGRAAAPVTLTGELVDVRCVRRGAGFTGAAHADCALSCARKGATLGILTADGLYVVTGESTRDRNRRLVPFVARTVDARGVTAESGGTRTIELTAIEARHL